MIEINSITDVVQYVSKLKVIIFDLDDTLYGEKEYVRSGYKQVAQIFPQYIDMEENLWNAFEKRIPAVDYVLKSLNIYSERMKEKCLEIYRTHNPDIHLYDGVEQMLLNFKSSGYGLGLITDGRIEGQKAKIKALNLERFFDKIIITDALGGISYRKPCEKAFVLMKEYFNVEYDEMCYVGDNISKDFIAPKKLGMECIWFKNRAGLYF